MEKLWYFLNTYQKISFLKFSKTIMFVKNSTMNRKEQLFSDFKPITKEEWIKKIENDLKGKSFEKLFWHPEDNISLPPFYTQKEIENLPHLHDTLAQESLDAIKGDWLTGEYFELNANELLSQLSVAIQNDVTAITINVNSDISALPELIAFINDHNAQIKKITFTGENQILQKLSKQASLLELIAKNPAIGFIFGFNFLSELTRFGEQSLETDYIATLQDLFASYDNVRFLSVDANDFHNAGASVVQELTFALEIGNSYLSYFNNSNEACRKISFRFAIGGSYFMEIAKLRAFRILWAKLLSLHDNQFSMPENIFIASETSQLNKTVYDPYVNMLRNATEAMSAILGGTDELTVLPFNFLFEQDDDFGKRIARNVQHLLRYETHLDEIKDIPAGAYYIENLTHIISEEVWHLFVENESKSGYESLAKSGEIKKAIEKNAARLIENFNKRKNILVGINNYPNFNETILEKISDHTIVQEPSGKKGLRFFRLSEALESLRLDIEASFSKRPKVFLFTIGNLAMRRARAGFALNFLGAASFDILDNNGFASVEEGLAAFKKSGADILVVCSADEEYVNFVPDIAKNINEKILIVAGNPKNIEMSVNVDYFIFSGSNILDTLQSIREQLLNIKVLNK